MNQQVNEQERKDFHKCFRAVFVEALSYVASLGPSAYLGQHYDWPQLSQHKNGMPSVSITAWGGPKDYSTAFVPVQGLREPPRIVSLPTFFEAVERSDLLRARLLPPKTEFSGEQRAYLELMLSSLVYDLVDRYVHVYGSAEFNEERFQATFSPLENGVFYDPLPLDIAIPILFVHFPCEEIQLSNSAWVRRMEDAFQLARASKKAYGPGVHDAVMAAATHALILENWQIPNRGRWPSPDITTEVGAYPLAQIDLFFAALRTETGAQTGYAQVLTVPRGWMHRWKAALPPLEGTSTRAYPLVFEDYYWRSEHLPRIDETTIQRVAQLWSTFEEAPENRLKVAARRLNLCFVRDLDEDVAIDACIGLEAALSDDEPHEMTHKLALRVAALSRYFVEFEKSAHQVFREIKAIYAYRSALVHGSSSYDKKREIRVSQTTRVEATVLAVEYLRAVLKVLATRPQFRDPTSIDRTLLLADAEVSSPEGGTEPTSKGR